MSRIVWVLMPIAIFFRLLLLIDSCTAANNSVPGGGAADVTLGRLGQLRPAPVELGYVSRDALEFGCLALGTTKARAAFDIWIAFAIGPVRA
jgi:hypothetical protein